MHISWKDLGFFFKQNCLDLFQLVGIGFPALLPAEVGLEQLHKEHRRGSVGHQIQRRTAPEQHRVKDAELRIICNFVYRLLNNNNNTNNNNNNNNSNSNSNNNNCNDCNSIKVTRAPIVLIIRY